MRITSYIILHVLLSTPTRERLGLLEGERWYIREYTPDGEDIFEYTKVANNAKRFENEIDYQEWLKRWPLDKHSFFTHGIFPETVVPHIDEAKLVTDQLLQWAAQSVNADPTLFNPLTNALHFETLCLYHFLNVHYFRDGAQVNFGSLSDMRRIIEKGKDVRTCARLAVIKAAATLELLRHEASMPPSYSIHI